jgi:hypothetical protein
MSGEVDVVVVASSSAASYVKNGRLRALAVLDGKRVASMADVPTAAEVGFPQLLAVNWYALLAPRDTPVAIVERLNAMPEHDRFIRGMVAWLGGRQTELLYDRDARRMDAFHALVGSVLARVSFGQRKYLPSYA